jgi:uncharacterized membrane protein
MQEPEPRPIPAHPFRTRLISGLLLLVPLWITMVVVRTIFGAMASFLSPIFKILPWPLSPQAELTISILTFLLLIYTIGTIASHVIGRRLVAAVESIILRLPVIKTIYGAAKQIVDAISLSNRHAFKSVVLVEYPRTGLWTIGFVSGILQVEGQRLLIKVFIPTVPNPTSGFLEFVPPEAVQSTSLTIEDGIKLVVSGGLLTPANMTITPFPAPPLPPSFHTESTVTNPLDAKSDR